jgi:hypothetical protein
VLEPVVDEVPDEVVEEFVAGATMFPLPSN